MYIPVLTSQDVIECTSMNFEGNVFEMISIIYLYGYKEKPYEKGKDKISTFGLVF